MANYIVTDTDLTGIADAIRAKTGGAAQLEFPTEFVSEIGRISGVTPTPTPSSNAAVRFLDYDGTVLHEYTAAEAQALTALPANPTHSGLTSEGWNYTLAQMKEHVTANGTCDIGQMYVTDDGKTRLYCHFEKGRLSPYLQLSPNGTVVVDWGDNSATDTLVGTSTGEKSIKSVQHNYSTPGDYVITLTVTGKATIWGANTSGNGSYLLQKSIGRSETYAGLVYRNAIKKIELGTGLEIQKGAFAATYSLKSINIPHYITSIGSYAFSNCRSLPSITVPDAVTSIGNNAFEYCYSLTSITIPDGITRIESYAFQGCNSLPNITIPDGVTSIENNAFYDCYSITSITIPGGVTSIESGAFQNCNSLTSITIPDGVTSIGNSVFWGCKALTSIIIPDGVTSIGVSAFQDCDSLTHITIPDGVTSIGNIAFQGCNSLPNITIPDGVTRIGNSVFNNCNSLTSITIPDGVTSISTYAFSTCYALTSLTIPDGVTRIESSAFTGCYGMVEYHFLSTTPPTLVSTNAFQNMPSDCKIYVPAASLEAYKSATNWASLSSYMVGE